MDRPRLIRGLRIAWSVSWGMLGVMLVVLWVRSYTWADVMDGGVTRQTGFSLRQVYGEFVIQTFNLLDPMTVESKFTVKKADEIANLQELRQYTLIGFALIDWRPFGWIVVLPHWFLALLFATIASVPWLRWKFSLSTLLIATTLIAVVLGLVVIMWH